MEIVIGDIYDHLASGKSDERMQGTFLCGFCNLELTNDDDDLVECKKAQAHAAAHRLAFETLLEQKTPFPACPICEEIIISQKSLSNKTGQVLFNDLDVVEHLEKNHFESLIEDFINDFDQPPYLGTTFKRKDSNGIRVKPSLHTSFVNCGVCGWTSANLQLESIAILSQEIAEHLYFHLEDQTFLVGHHEVEENILKKAEIGSLRRSVTFSENIDLSSLPYAEKLAILYPKQLIKLFGPAVVIVIRCLHGLRLNPFLNADMQNGFDERIRLLKSKGGSCSIAQGLQGLFENLSSDLMLPEREKGQRERIYECGREECGHAKIDFGSSARTISHLLAHARHEEARLFHSMANLTPYSCRCGVQAFSPMGIFYHMNNSHFFEDEDIEENSIEAKIIAKADMLVNVFGQSCFRGLQRPRHQVVLMELQSRIVLEKEPGEEKNWPLLPAAIQERWYVGWENFVRDSLTSRKIVNFLCLSPFEDVIYYDGTASILYPDVNPKTTFAKAHQHFLRFYKKSRDGFPTRATQLLLETGFLKRYRLNLRRKRERRLRLAQKSNAFHVPFDVSHLTKAQLGNHLGIRNQKLFEQSNQEVDSESEELSDNEKPGPSQLNSLLIPKHKSKGLDFLINDQWRVKEEVDEDAEYGDFGLYCRICPNTSFVLGEMTIQTHAAAHAVLLLRLSSSSDFHSDGIYSCPICPYEPSACCRASDFDVAGTVRHLMGRHSDIITQIYKDYLQQKYPPQMFTQKFSSLREAEADPSHGRLVFSCKRTESCKMPEFIGSTVASRGFLCRLDTDLQILKHLLFHIRVDKGLELEPQDRELLTRCLMVRMGTLNEKNLAIHLAKIVSKYAGDSQAMAVKFIIAKLRTIATSVFELDAPWVLKLVFPISNLRLHLSQVFPQAPCQKCTVQGRLDHKTRNAVSFIVDPTTAALHAMTHNAKAGIDIKPESRFDCPMCGEILFGDYELISHLLASHPICINTGLLFPFLSTLSLTKTFSSLLSKVFGSQSWQVELAAGFSSQQPKHCSQLIQSPLNLIKAPMLAARKRPAVNPQFEMKPPKIEFNEPRTIAEALSRLG
ncbi:unnamed protein product, partial [Mesorhabditis belari]|uniref:C2H2-type domain-containing protein n=1 Tax=Mesorhabditis belari TaxID=2138241 RepID=A0AAF3F4D5_9BILA